MSIKDTLIKKFQDKTARIGILGMGYVGLPLAVVFAEAGFNVLGIDPDPRKTDAFSRNISYIQDVPTETVVRLHQSGRRRAQPRSCSGAGARRRWTSVTMKTSSPRSW